MAVGLNFNIHEDSNGDTKNADLLLILKNLVTKITQNKLGHPENLQREIDHLKSDKAQITEQLNKQFLHQSIFCILY